MATLTVSTTGVGPSDTGNPTECHKVSDIETRRYFEPTAEVAILRMDIQDALDIAYDLLYQAVDAGAIAGWSVSFPERDDA